jgi:hypothetical protein
MPYRVFIGTKGSRVYHGTYKTKGESINALLAWLNMRHFAMPDQDERDITRRAEMILLSDRERILKERFKAMPSGLYGPLYTFPLGSICNA